jgi:hypothetical protein
MYKDPAWLQVEPKWQADFTFQRRERKAPSGMMQTHRHPSKATLLQVP